MCFFLFTLTLLICNRYTHFYSFCLLPRVIFVLLTTQAAGLGDAEQALGMTCWSATGRGSRESACLCWTGSSGHQRPPPWLWGFPFNSAPLLIPGPSPQPPSGGRWACPRPMATGCQAGGREQGGDWAGAPEVVRGALVRRQPGTGSARPVRACVRARVPACVPALRGPGGRRGRDAAGLRGLRRGLRGGRGAGSRALPAGLLPASRALLLPARAPGGARALGRYGPASGPPLAGATASGAPPRGPLPDPTPAPLRTPQAPCPSDNLTPAPPARLHLRSGHRKARSPRRAAPPARAPPRAAPSPAPRTRSAP